MITNLKLHYFRNHVALNISCDAPFICIVGKNGVGKSNILEAISYFIPGKGMRGNKFEDVLTNTGSQKIHEWGAMAEIRDCIQQRYKIVTAYNAITKNRSFKINDDLLQKQADVLQYIKVIWLTPAMNNLFIESSNIRRRFFDRICYSIYPAHAQEVLRYEFYLKSRLKILMQPIYDEEWLKSIEYRIACAAVKIYAIRMRVLELMQRQLQLLGHDFLRPYLSFTTRLIPDVDTDAQVDYVLRQYKKYRTLDKANMRSSFNIHKMDLVVFHPIKQHSALYCSTGEQKSMLVSIILAQAQCIYAMSNIAPILLLDELLSSIDFDKKHKLLTELRQVHSQVWMTTIDTTSLQCIQDLAIVIDL